MQEQEEEEEKEKGKKEEQEEEEENLLFPMMQNFPRPLPPNLLFISRFFSY